MFASLKLYLAGAGVAIAAIFYAIFTSTRKENQTLKSVVKEQMESLKVVSVKDEVSNKIHISHKIEEASIEKSIKETKVQLDEATSPLHVPVPLDPNTIKLLNSNSNKV